MRSAFPERLKVLREQFGYTQESLGKRINVSAAAINRYEKGLRQPDPDMLCLWRICLKRPLMIF